MDGGPRGPRDDFFCWKFRVWYNLRDCVYRHAFKTHPECAECGQGELNLKLLGRVPAPPRWAEIARVDADRDARSEVLAAHPSSRGPVEK